MSSGAATCKAFCTTYSRMLWSPSFLSTSDWPSTVVASLPAARITAFSGIFLEFISFDIQTVPAFLAANDYRRSYRASHLGNLKTGGHRATTTNRNKSRQHHGGYGREQHPHEKMLISDFHLDPSTDG